ncbi:MAG: asparaginase [Elusimicrobiaceae bacterium]|jgi:L-asparaginase|nr:asparaginase [Elusimicrobiaceae bacterium]MBT3955480.1 asparaginase [Elusimicrobiaceae bacterium]MBT4008347.1 asparaginase [Elusimicrobiaceae bacterium]MBT4403192.1 asparaginase [Elusimicrobiaceae bacterium]MBT4440082.1 asparaginase [Elusimicrobiaceae bacterium]
MAIKILITGGTFDKEYNEINGELFFKKTHIKEMLELGRCKLNIKQQVIMLKDSLHMNTKDRQQILSACKSSKEKQIVITHGTDTMPETAKFLGKNLASLKNKTIILTGAMIPYKFGSSDGLFNLGSALSFAQSMPANIYIAINGKIFNWDNVKKNKKAGRFETLKRK